MSVFCDTEKLLRGLGVVDERGNSLPGFETQVALQRDLDVLEDAIVAAGAWELGVMLELERVMAKTRFLHEGGKLRTDKEQVARWQF